MKQYCAAITAIFFFLVVAVSGCGKKTPPVPPPDDAKQNSQPDQRNAQSDAGVALAFGVDR